MLEVRNEYLRAKHNDIRERIRKLKNFYIKSLTEKSFKCRKQQGVKTEEPCVSMTQQGMEILDMDIKLEEGFI